MIEKVVSGSLLIAIIIRSNFQQLGIHFFTENHFSQQLGYMNRAAGYKIAPHRHNLVAREVVLTQEVLFIKSGKVRVDFYSESQQYIESQVLQTGDVILLAAGGHGFEMLEPTEMIEVKQGPYVGERDKVHFSPVADDEVIIKDNGN